MKVSFTFHLGDGLDLCTSSARLSIDQRFDVIDTSNVADHAGLLNVLVTAGTRLRPGGFSKLHTETMQWHTIAATMQDYLDRALGMPPEMFPSVLGLRLLTNMGAGRPAIPDMAYKLNTASDNRQLVWVGVPCSGATQVQPQLVLDKIREDSPDCGIAKAISGLVDLCGLVDVPDRQETAGLRLYSTVTLARLLVGLLPRVQLVLADGSSGGSSSNQVEELLCNVQLLLPPQLHLSWRTAMLRVLQSQRTISLPGSSLVPSDATDATTGATSQLVMFTCRGLTWQRPGGVLQPLVNVWLLPPGQAPPSLLDRMWGAQESLPGAIHVLDVVQCVLDDQDGTLDISFLLPEDHGLPDDASVAVMDQTTSMMLGPLQQLNRYQQSLAHVQDILLVPGTGHLDGTGSRNEPSQRTISSTKSPCGKQVGFVMAESDPQDTCSTFTGALQLRSFTEEASRYLVQLTINGTREPRGLMVRQNGNLLSFSTTHHLDITLRLPKGTGSLSLTSPIVADDMVVSLDKVKKLITMELPKGRWFPFDLQNPDLPPRSVVCRLLGAAARFRHASRMAR